MKKHLYLIFFLSRFLVLAIACFIPFSVPHVWRQTVSMGIAYRYFSRFQFETLNPSFWLNLVPASLNSSDYFGYVATEFPILNLLVVPCFLWGGDWGQILARLLLLLILGLTVLAIARMKTEFPNGISFAKVVLLFPVITLGGVYFGKFIPDPLATLLVFFAVVASWKAPRPWISLLAASLGLLIKPTSIVVFGLLFFRPAPLLKRVPVWVFVSVLLCAVYYKFAIPAMLEIQDSPFPFQVTPKPPLRTLWEFLKMTGEVFHVFGRYLFSQVGLILMVAGYFTCWRQFSKTHWGLWLLLILQFLSIGMLDGVHSFQHIYYYMGLLPTVILILLEFLSVTKPNENESRLNAIVYFGLIGVLAVNVLKYTARDLQLMEPTPYFVEGYQASCKTLKLRNPDLPWNKGYVFRSPQEAFPELGLCFGERSSSTKAEFGFFPAGQFDIGECQELDREGALVLVRCQSRSRLFMIPNDDFK